MPAKKTISEERGDRVTRGGDRSTAFREELMRRLGRHDGYEDYELLFSDKDLWALMLVPFSPELAELTQQMSEPAGPVDEVKRQPVSKDERTVREAVARALDKAPSQVTDSDYENVTSLDLINSSIRDLKELEKLKSLQKLNLNGAQVSDVGPLALLTSLQRLYLVGTQVSEEQVAELQKALPKLEIYR